MLLATTPFWLARLGLYQYLALEVMVWMLFALGYNLMLGTTGLPSFGHGAFFGVGAYAFGLLQQRVLANLWFDLAGAIVIAAALGALVGACIAHKRGIYFALLTIAFGQVFWFVAVKWHSVTGGEDGLQNIARPLLPLGFATRRTCAATRRCSTSASSLFALSRASSSGGSSTRRSGASSRRSGRTRCAPPSSATTSGSTSGS